MSANILFSSVAVGDQLPPLEIDVSAKQIVTGALASRDFQDVHHDKARAQELGSPDIFMNILTSNGLVGRYVTDWAGPKSRLKKVAIRLGAPNYPGDKMVMKGEITEKDEAQQTIGLSVIGTNSLGQHVIGTVVVALATE